ncbi:MAG: hypothetical protein ACREQY_14015, partial [Candidatus Binatia bacterium]
LTSTTPANGFLKDLDPVLVLSEGRVAGWAPLAWVLAHPEVLALAAHRPADDSVVEEEDEDEDEDL